MNKHVFLFVIAAVFVFTTAYSTCELNSATTVLTGDSWYTINTTGTGCSSINVTAKGGYIYNGSSWRYNTTLTIYNPHYISVFFNITGNKIPHQIVLSNNGLSRRFFFKASAISFDFENERGCPGEKVRVNLTLDNSPYIYNNNGQKIYFLSLTSKDGVLIKYVNTTNHFYVTIPKMINGVSMLPVSFKLMNGGVLFNYNITFDTYPIVGLKNYTFSTVQASKFNCYNEWGLPVPCANSYFVNLNAYKNSQNFKVKLIVNDGEYNNTYYANYTGVNPITFGFIGSTNEKCTYYAIPNLPSTNGYCTNSLVFSGACPVTSNVKKYHDVKVEALPLHLNYGIFNETLIIQNNTNIERNSTLFKLANNYKIPSYGGNVGIQVKRYYYHWNIAPFNWLVSVLMNNVYIPITVGYNQTSTNSILASSLNCNGNSVCYTKLPYCGDGICDASAGESCLTCKQDCACGSNTLGCYGVPNIKGFTDSHGCVLKYKTYEQNCTFSQECDPSEGLTCVHTEVGGTESAVGHCCKPGEIWDPNTPKGFHDANSSIKGTCLVPRGVKITKVDISFDGSDTIHTCTHCNCLGSVCLGKILHGDPRVKIDTYVHSYNPKGDYVCVLVATQPDYCACDNQINNEGGGRIVCKKVYGTAHFTTWISERSPFEQLGLQKYCAPGSTMLILAYLPTNNFTYMPNEYVNTTDWNSFWSQFKSLTSDFPNIEVHTTPYGYSHIIAKTPKGSHETTESDYTNSIYVDGHPGNIFINANGKYSWADLIVIHSSASSPANNDYSAGGSVTYAEEITPSSHLNDYPTNGLSHFICGGYSFW